MRADPAHSVAFLSGAGLVFALASTTRYRARRDYVRQGRLRPSTSVLAYLAYGFHAVLLGAAAWREPRPLAIGKTAARIAGIALAGAGTALQVGGQTALAGPEMSGTRMGGLATGGAYQISRNPQLVGWGLVLLGIAVAARSASALGLWAGYVAALPGTICDEERALEHAYGSQYRMYRRGTPRYLGFGSIGVTG